MVTKYLLGCAGPFNWTFSDSNDPLSFQLALPEKDPAVKVYRVNPCESDAKCVLPFV